MKQSIKRLYRKVEGIWDDDLPDIHGKHRRKIKKSKVGKIRRILKEQTINEIKDYETW